MNLKTIIHDDINRLSFDFNSFLTQNLIVLLRQVCKEACIITAKFAAKFCKNLL